MTATTLLIPEVDIDTRDDIFRRAAARKGLTILQDFKRDQLSGPIAHYTNGEAEYTLLEKYGIKIQKRPDGILSLVDENSDDDNYWNFWRSDNMPILALEIALHIRIGMDPNGHGVIFMPQAFNRYVSAGNDRAHRNLFKALVHINANASDLEREMAACGAALLMTWEELGFKKGICSLHNLFEDFAQGRESILKLADSDIFDPVPSPRYEKPGEKRYVVKSAQRKVLEVWRLQLEEYRESLTV